MQRTMQRTFDYCCRLASRNFGQLHHTGAASLPSHHLISAKSALRSTVVESWSGGGLRRGISTLADISVCRSLTTTISLRSFATTTPHTHNNQHKNEKEEKEEVTHQHHHQHEEPNCWNCSAFLGTGHNYFCSGCSTIQPLDKKSDYFTLFGYAAPTFNITPENLEMRYKRLQVQLHPDRFATMSAQEQQHSANQAAAVNQAHDVLRQPLKRAQYLLTLQGRGACEGFTVTDPDLLEPVMEAREEVDAAETTEELAVIIEKVKQQEALCVEELSEAFAAEQIDKAAESTTVLRYLVRIKEAAIEKM